MDLIYFFNSNDLALTNKVTGENWVWSKDSLQNLRGFMSTPIHIKLYQLVYVVGGIIILSFATSLFTKIVTLLSPLLLYALGKLINFD